MMFSVSDLVGVNRFTERILANAAAAAYGMSLVAGTMEANVVPERYRDHRHVFHRPRIFVPRLDREEIVRVAHEISRRLRHTSARAVFMVPLRGVGRYSVLGGPLHDPESDRAFFDALRAGLPSSVEVVEVDAQAEAPAFVREAVRRRTRRPHQSFNGRVTKSEV